MGIKINRGQVTIFIILGILIVVAIIAVFFFFGRSSIQDRQALNPETYIGKCIKDAVSPSVERVLAGGGRIDPELYKMYKSEKYNYLCYQKNYYLTCVNHYPQIKMIIEQEIKNDSEARVKQCFATLKDELEKKHFSVSDSGFEWSVELNPKKVIISVNKRLEVSKEESSQSYDKFSAEILSPVFDLAMVAREIANQESQYCNFEYNGFMLLYPEYKIERIDYDESKIYIISDRNSGKIFKFAVRSCAFPPGI